MHIRRTLGIGAATAVALLVALGVAAPAQAVEIAPTQVVSVASPTTASRSVPARDLGPCWAQAGRVVGGGVVVIGTTVTAPWLSPAALAAYLGQMAQEHMSDGYFTC